MNQLLFNISRELVFERLPFIFPEGTPNRRKCIGKAAASTIFTMLYIGAIEESGRYMAPVHVVRMSDEQAAMTDRESRIAYHRNFKAHGKRWYEDNSRETIRDEVIREGLIPLGAVLSLSGIPTTSSKPRYYLQKDFAELFNPLLVDNALNKAIADWQTVNLSKGALTRISLAKLGSKGDKDYVLVTFPNRETRSLTPGPSTQISKAVIEVFAINFLEEPGLLWLSTSDGKVVASDERLAESIGLKINVSNELPDIILVDLKPKYPLLIFVEVVATDGAVTERRQKAIYELSDAAGFDRSQVAFVTAYLDRNSSGFSKTIKNLAWNSFAWFVSEPDKLVVFKNGIIHLSKIRNE